VGVEQVAMRVWFVPLDPSAPKIFGFSEFLAGLALMVLAWTLADVRYRFRISTAAIPLYGSTFAIMAAVGASTLLTDVWRAQGWLVPKVRFINPASWQALLAGTYFLTFLVWAFFAFIKPATFSKWNAKRFAQTLFGVIVKGSPLESAVVANELRASAKSIVFNATGDTGPMSFPPGSEARMKKPSRAERYANDIPSLIADRRFCRAIVESAPSAAWAFFEEMGEQKKYGIQIQRFANNIVNEALENKNSFLYHETAGYESGLIGSYKPICQAIFSNYQMVECIGSVLDTDFLSRSKWDSDQWEAYCRVVLITLHDYVEKRNTGHSYVLYRALTDIKNALSDLSRLNGAEATRWTDDVWARLRVVVKFIEDAVGILEKNGAPADRRGRDNRRVPQRSKSMYDHVANLIHDVIFEASYVKSPRDLSWSIQHNALWGELFNFGRLDGPAGKLVKRKVCRLLYDDILEMNRLPNFMGANILGFCINVMGLQLGNRDYYRDSRAFHRAILIWTRKNFARIYDFDPRVAEACLVDGITYDFASHRIVKTYPAGLGQRTGESEYLDIDSPPAATERPGHGTRPVRISKSQKRDS
jgi:hypothetical protein